MWINVPTNLRELKHPDMDESVDLGDGESVQVTQEVGELLVKEYDEITETKTDS